MRVVVALLIVVMFAGCTGGNPDKDNDGLSDSQEKSGSLLTITYMDRRIEKAVTSDPKLADTDGDGVTDLYEVLVNSDPRNKDTDEDGLTDCQEVQHTNATQCEDPNWDGEWDGGYGTAPNNADSDRINGRYKKSQPFLDETTQPPNARGDGISDGDEVNGYWINSTFGKRFVTTDPLEPDTDMDALEDGEEVFVYGSHPLVKDTDDDGCQDGHDLFPQVDMRYDVNMSHFVWNEAGQSGSVATNWRVLMVDVELGQPGGRELPWNLQHGKDYTPEELRYEPTRVADCNYAPFDPWVRIDIIIEREKSGSGYILNLYESNPIDPRDGLGRYGVWWNVHENVFRWAPGEPSFTPLTSWSGPDGELHFQPRLVPPSAS